MQSKPSTLTTETSSRRSVEPGIPEARTPVVVESFAKSPTDMGKEQNHVELEGIAVIVVIIDLTEVVAIVATFKVLTVTK